MWHVRLLKQIPMTSLLWILNSVTGHVRALNVLLNYKEDLTVKY